MGAETEADEVVWCNACKRIHLSSTACAGKKPEEIKVTSKTRETIETALRQSSQLGRMTDKEISEELLSVVWASMRVYSYESDVVSSVIDRLKRANGPAIPEPVDEESTPS